MRRLAFLPLIVLLAPHNLAAASLNPKIEEICTQAPKPGQVTSVDHRRLVGYLLKSQQIYDVDLDKSGGDVSYAQKTQAILRFDRFCAAGTCSKDAEAKLAEALGALYDFLKDHSRPLPAGQNGFVVTPAIVDRPDPKALQAFLEGNGGYQLACVAATLKPEPQPEQTQAEKEVAAAFANVRIRKNIEDLRVSRTSKKFDSVDRANIGLNKDYVKRSQTFSLEGVAGVPLTEDRASSWILFTSYKAQHVNPASKTPNTGNVGVGLLNDSRFMVGEYEQSLQLFSHLVHSYVTDSNLVTGNVVFTPDFLFPGVGIAYNPNDGPFAFLIKPQLKLFYAHVIDAGTNPILVADKEYLRAGPRVEFWIFGTTGLVKNYSFNTNYEFQEAFRGPFDVARLESKLVYTFPEQQNWSLQLSYVNGRDLNTLERQKQLTLGLGYRQ
ncbi:MAG TPA: hypothetical protein VN930_01800 [Xanthobacteraceae bacterium]|nr:hypothetical protein [Xanthobacteraceae bacterium]